MSRDPYEAWMLEREAAAYAGRERRAELDAPSGAELIAAERQRQIEREGWTADPGRERARGAARVSGKRSRNKGAAGELELARLLTEYGFDARRTPNSGGLAIKGDLTAIDGAGPAIPGFHLEGKRCETLRIPEWLKQAHADAGGLVPLVAFRRNKTRALDPLNEWHGLLPLRALLGYLRELEELRAEVKRLRHALDPHADERACGYAELERLDERAA